MSFPPYERDNDLGQQDAESGTPTHVERVSFGPEARAYLREYLQESVGYGKHFGQMLLAKGPDRGSLWGWLPVDAREIYRTDFKRGGAFYPRTSSTTLQSSVTAWLEGLARDEQGGPWVAVGEDVLFAPTATWTRSFPTVTCADSVYEFHPVASDPGRTAWLFGGAEWRPEACVLSPASVCLRDGAQVTRDLLHEIVDRARAVVIGAWDDEAYLVWEPGVSTDEIPVAARLRYRG